MCNLRFADDVILLATSKNQLKQMIHDLSIAAEEVGLELHMGKTKILTNQEKTGSVEVRGARIDIVEETEYLGRRLTLKDTHATKVRNRVTKALEKFMALKQKLC